MTYSAIILPPVHNKAIHAPLARCFTVGRDLCDALPGGAFADQLDLASFCFPPLSNPAILVSISTRIQGILSLISALVYELLDLEH